MLVARQGRRHRAGRTRLTRATSASSMHSQAFHYSSRFLAPEAQLLSVLRRPSLRRPNAASNVRLLKTRRSTRRCQRRSTRLVPLPLLLLVVRLRLRASVFSALRPARDRHTPTARPCAACAARSPRARPPPRGPARLSAGQARRVRSPARRVPPVLQPPCARALLSLNARCTLLAPPSAPRRRPCCMRTRVARCTARLQCARALAAAGDCSASGEASMRAGRAGELLL